jgi:hypothetical protein
VQRPRAGHLVEPARAGQRVDRPPLPGQAAEDGLASGGGGDARRRERADDVAAPADAEAQGARRALQDLLCRAGQA